MPLDLIFPYAKRGNLGLQTFCCPFFVTLAFIIWRTYSPAFYHRLSHGIGLNSCRVAMKSGKHQLNIRQPVKFKKRKIKPIIEGSRDDVLLWEIKSLLGEQGDREASTAPSETDGPSFSLFDEIEVDITELSSSGDLLLGLANLINVAGEGLGVVEDGRMAIVVPFVVPGRQSIPALS